MMTLLLVGCANTLDQYGVYNHTVYPAVYPVDHPAPVSPDGAIYQAGYDRMLFADHVARNVGDILTVRLEEQTKGMKQTNMKNTRTTANNTDAGSSKKPVLFGGNLNATIFDTGTNLSFDGKGDTGESNQLQGTVSVSVTRVLSNDNMVVQGESWVTINEGREYIRLTGIVRPEDIDAQNSVSSQRIAEARISYSGNGQVADVSREGVLTQLIYKFFPY